MCFDGQHASPFNIHTSQTQQRLEDGIMWSIHSSEALLCIDSPMDLNKRQGPTMGPLAEGVEHEQEGQILYNDEKFFILMYVQV